jgi:hypothetical protein
MSIGTAGAPDGRLRELRGRNGLFSRDDHKYRKNKTKEPKQNKHQFSDQF